MALEILERRAICHVQICTKLSDTNGGKKVYSICIVDFMVSLDTGLKKESRANEVQFNEKKSPRRGGKWRLLTEKGRRFVCVLGFMTAAATVVGWVWTARGGGEAPPVAGSRAEPQAEIVKCFDRCRRKETRSKGRPAAHTPKVRSGRSRVGVGCVCI